MDETYIKNFKQWNIEKEQLNHRELPLDFFFLEREIWGAAIGINIGREMDGKNDNYERPILVIKKINEELLWAMPITSTQKNEGGFCSIIYKDKPYTLAIQQMRTLSSNRLLRMIARISETDFVKILENISQFLLPKQNETPVSGGISVDVTGE